MAFPTRAPDRAEQVFAHWCALTATDPTDVDEPEVEAFLARPEVVLLGAVPDTVLREAGTTVRRACSLPLERWLYAARTRTV